jgi:pyridoxine 5-phosphate synthase
MKSLRLGVNVDHVATLRQARHTLYPDPVAAALQCELAGADQITVHLREDRRHIQDRDLHLLRQLVTTQLNLEMAATPDGVKAAFETKPDLVTLVPERREEVTTEGGLNVVVQRDQIRKIVRNLQDAEITVSLFLDPDIDQIQAAHRIDCRRVELHTGRFCDARTRADRARELGRLVDAAKAADHLGLGVAAGHGLNYDNLQPVAAILEIDELNIGHAVIARALFCGLDRAVRDLRDLMERARSEE